MRTQLTKLASLFAFAVLMLATACSDDEKTRKNELVIDGTSHTITTVFDQNWKDSDKGTSVYSLVFITEGVSVVKLDNYIDFEGNGKLLFWQGEVDSEETQIPSGSYTDFDIYLYNLENDNFSNIPNTEKNGPFKITKSGTTYTMEGKLKNGSKEYSLYYRGPLTTEAIIY